MPSADFPDWNPPRDRAAFRTVDTIFTNIAAGDTFEPSYDATALDNAVVVQGILAPSTAIHVGSLTLFASVENLRGAINAGVDPVPFLIVCGFAGVPVYVELLNLSAVSWPVLVFIDTVAGVVPDQMLPAQLMAIKNGIAVPAMSEADPYVVGNAGEYTRATVQVTCDQPFKVSVRRSWINPDPTPAIVSADELLSTSIAAGSTFADVAVGANGFAVVVEGTSVTAATAAVVVRLYRSGGF